VKSAQATNRQQSFFLTENHRPVFRALYIVALTRQLFYASCRRAQKSLAIIAYSKDPKKAKANAISQRLLEENEVILL